MKEKGLRYIKDTLFPCFVLSGTAGVITGALIFLFKVCASFIMNISKTVYGFVHDNPIYLPLLLIALVAISVLAALLLKWEPNCKGGGIPTSIAILRGLITFKWLRNIIVMFASAMLTYLGGVPLGNEGPSVQIGTAVGRGTVRLFGKKSQAWDRYIMTGGACAGFAAATGAPISGMLFSLEEAHKRFTPLIFIIPTMTVIAGSFTTKILCTLFDTEYSMFIITPSASLPLRFIWSALIVGAVCAIIALAFAKLYQKLFNLFTTTLAKIPLVIKFIVIFAIVGVMGVISTRFIGSGHDVAELALEGHGVWYMFLLYLCVRVILLLVATNAGVTGGLFVPSLAFGALIGAICGKVMVSAGMLSAEYYGIMVIVGMTAFLSASSRTPLTAIVFALEALGGYTNILPIAAGVMLAYVVAESVNVTEFAEIVIEAKMKSARKDKKITTIKKSFTVQKNAFVVGKEMRDIMWPPDCIVTSIEKAPNTTGTHTAIGDVLHIQYVTCDDNETFGLLETLVGEQIHD